MLFLPSLGGGGAERVAVTLANEMSAIGVDVHMVLASANGPYLGDVGPGITLVDLKSSRVLMSFGRLVKYIRTTRPDVVLSHLNYANIVAIPAVRLAGVKTRVYAVEHASIQKYFEKASLKKKLVRKLMGLLYPMSDGVIAVSQGIRNELLDGLGLRSTTTHAIFNPIVHDQIAKLCLEPVSEIDILPRPIVMSAGRMVAQKGFDDLLRAFAALRNSTSSLVILGTGPDREALASLAKELGVSARVHMPGFVANPYAWMAKADLFVMSSRFEGLPTVLVEAMACGVQVVSTDCLTGPREILSDGEFGTLVPVGKPEQLSLAIQHVLSGKSNPADVVGRAKEFSVRAAVATYVSTLGL